MRGAAARDPPLRADRSRMILGAVLCFLMGITLGLLGGGGSILTLPILVYVLHEDVKGAIAASLLVVGATAALAAGLHARAGAVRWRYGLALGPFAMAGAFAGGLAAGRFPDRGLLLGFVAVMVVVGGAMLTGAGPSSDAPPRARRAWLMAPTGLGIGLVTGLVGAGGGFLFVPALSMLGGLPMREAVGTSLVVIALNAASGFLGHLRHGGPPWPTALLATGCALAGAALGTMLAGRVRPEALRKAFGWFVLAMAGVMLWKELG